ncbi:hypothetical protein [Anabaena sp. UHCC 0399]|uniref:hypothetical protein n=1 Tax=Anabaena sp. UHCC 0399 TaxID=3110238 RepID=UPI002B21F6D3|nr:hypothetical protein [Anabaena sp. UHCC 0399]MEA5565164.1 hypothetical protein [Anabaena sp. UHCC 0399]
MLTSTSSSKLRRRKAACRQTLPTSTPSPKAIAYINLITTSAISYAGRNAIIPVNSASKPQFVNSFAANAFSF